jgi:DNA helicase-2/ATP-dependent DNA helicase PcrA
MKEPMSDPFDFESPRGDRAQPAPAYAPKPGGLAARAREAAAGGTAFLDGLNPEQREAIEAIDGPVLVLAGAGTGKTRVLTTRIAHILATSRARSHEILAVTFTNKAAREMKERVARLAGPVGEGMPWLGTFHAISTKILRRHAELVGLRSSFTILDTDDQIRLLKQIIKAEDIDDKRWPARILAWQIDGWKNRGLTPDKVPPGEAASFANGKGGDLYRMYQERLKILDAADFGDLLLESLRLFRENPDVLAQYQQRFKFILVDEYQDTNIVQYLWLRLLAQGRSNICCVGDDDQCLAEGALITRADGAATPIETIEAGDSVLSAFGSGDVRPARVLRVHRSVRDGDMIRIRTKGGRTITSTPEHAHFAGYRLGLTPQTWFVYLMRKDGVGFRVGTTRIYTKGQKQPVLGFMQRCLQEHADALWVLSTHANENEARLEEMRVSLVYGLPQIPFVSRVGKGVNGVVHDAALIARLFAAIDTRKAAESLLADVGLSPKEPHHQPQSRNASRRNVTLTLCGDRRGKTPMHRIAMVGNDAEGAETLRALGFSVRPAKVGSASWRFETANADWRALAAHVETLREAFAINLIRNARLGGDNVGTDVKTTNSLPFTRAASVRPGMAMFTADGYDIVEIVERVGGSHRVFDLDVEATHNYVANGIVTHNSIYGWRGAEVDNILRFEKDFPGAKVIRLERNYRSTGHILGAAAHLIAHNEGRLGKTLFTDDELGARPTVSGVWDSEEEARNIGEEIEQAQRRGHSLDQVAILVRASFQMREFEDRFITLGLPYKVIGGPRFYERAEIRDALAYLRVVAQPADDLGFERIFNQPKRGLGDATLQVLHDFARRERIPLTRAAAIMVETEELKPKQRQTLRLLMADFARWASLIGQKPHNELAEQILEESGYTDMWKADRSADAAGRLDNLKELVRSMEEFPDLGAFLEHISLVMDAEARDAGPRVSIMTLHAAKGLEFDMVFLPGWEEGLFPHQRSLDENGRAGLEEERRLAYVGITRARRNAHIYFATNRRIHGLWQTTIPSRFLDELPAAHVEVVEAKGGQYGGYAQSRFANMDTYGSSYDTPGWKRAQQRGAASGGKWGQQAGGAPRRAPLQIEGELVAKSSVGSAYSPGARVFHLKFGPGTVAAVDGNKLTVDFDKAGRKMVLESFVERK